MRLCGGSAIEACETSETSKHLNVSETSLKPFTNRETSQHITVMKLVKLLVLVNLSMVAKLYEI